MKDMELGLRGRMVAASLALIAGLLAAGTCDAAPVHLRCNYRDKPLGIDTAKPALSWQSDSTERDWRQAAYEIVVASRADLARAGKGDVWDSGRKESAESVDVAYAGPALESRHRYYWTVRVWDAKGRRAVAAEPSWWEMGLLHHSDWSALWVTSAVRAQNKGAGIEWLWLPSADAMNVTPGTPGRFRYTLELRDKPMRAMVYAAAKGDYKVLVNGQQVDSKARWTAFDAKDVSDALHVGSNVVEVDVKAALPDGAPEGAKTAVAGAAALLTLTAKDGSETRIGSDGRWEASADGTAWRPSQVIAELADAKMGGSAGVPAEPVTLLRAEFTEAKALKRARLYVTAAGSYRMSINGKRVGETDLTPDFTDYRKRIEYQTYDVTAMVSAGKNVIGTELGDGWYASPMTWGGFHTFSLPVRLMAQLEIEYTDGTKNIVATNADWQTAIGPIVDSTIYGGEIYDARLERHGWDAAGYSGKDWMPAVVTDAPQGAVVAQVGLPVHQTDTIVPKTMTKLANGDWVFDMGQNMVGWATLHVIGRAGTTVRMRFAERLNPDGTIYTENLRNADAEDIYTLRGGAMETYAPHFTFHGFKYVEVSGLGEHVTPATLTGDVLNSLEKQPTGKLETSSELLNKMWQLGIWGQRGNFVSIPTDCPQRDERLGWMGDAGVFWSTGAYNFDIAPFTQKFMDDIVDAQGREGNFSIISPDILTNQGPFQGAPSGVPGWGDAGVIVPYTAWQQYGDRGLIVQHWDAMERWMEFIAKTNPKFLRENALGPNFADWLAPDQSTSKTLVGTAYWAIQARMMRDMAKATGHDDGKYTALYEHIREAYEKAYVGSSGEVLSGSQTAYLLTLYAGLAPENERAAMTEKLVASIKAHGNHLTTGFLGTPFLLFVLSQNGRSDVAYDLLMQDTYPSWGYMVAKGATTWWERWNGDTGDPGMNSYNHYSFGSVVAWMYRDTVGIDTDVATPGFRHVVIQPHYTERLTFARGEYESVYGTVKSGWTRTAAGGYHLSVTVPANATATVYPDGEGKGKPVEIGSGTYSFDAKPM